MRFAIRLWSINRWLRWTGWRLDVGRPTPPEDGPTTLGLSFCGWSFIGHEPAKGRWP